MQFPNLRNCISQTQDLHFPIRKVKFTFENKVCWSVFMQPKYVIYRSVYLFLIFDFWSVFFYVGFLACENSFYKQFLILVLRIGIFEFPSFFFYVGSLACKNSFYKQCLILVLRIGIFEFLSSFFYVGSLACENSFYNTVLDSRKINISHWDFWIS